jgi:hypothetical protein
MEWEARPSTLPRRQGRRGRHYDFAQWYPRVAVFDREGWQVQPLLPQGEFYGEFGSYDVSLDLAADQVIGATGVPVEGDPGWAAAAAVPGTQPELRRDAYAPRSARGWACWPTRRKPAASTCAGVPRTCTTSRGAPAPTTSTRVAVWRHRHPRALPARRHGVGGRHRRRQDRGRARLLRHDLRTYPWPQITNLHRIESGGTEFPMLS